MLFWKTEFCKKMPAEKFEKDYAYGVRHAYGKEGKRVDYTPHTCMKCISANPGAGEHHGCPYKTFGEESLRAALGGLQIAPRQVGEIVEKAKGQHYQLACGMTFEALHGVAIAAARLVALDALAVGLAAIPEAAFPRAEVALEGALEATLRAKPALDVEDGFRHELHGARGLDASAGRTLAGPHRSDLQVVYAAKNMPAGDCSTGEQKALLVGLILAQAHSVAARTGDVPLVLLVEVAAHLDANRRDALAEILAGLGGQSWITGTDASAFSGFSDVTAIDMRDDATGRGAA